MLGCWVGGWVGCWVVGFGGSVSGVVSLVVFCWVGGCLVWLGGWVGWFGWVGLMLCKIGEWLPIISSAVGVHMELLDHARSSRKRTETLFFAGQYGPRILLSSGATWRMCRDAAANGTCLSGEIRRTVDLVSDLISHLESSMRSSAVAVSESPCSGRIILLTVPATAPFGQQDNKSSHWPRVVRVLVLVVGWLLVGWLVLVGVGCCWLLVVGWCWLVGWLVVGCWLVGWLLVVGW